MNIYLIISIVAVFIALVAIFISIYLYRKVSVICTTDNKKSLVSIITTYQKNVDDVKEAHKALIDELKNVGKMSYKSIQKIGFLRYNPFEDSGGNQSFSIALLDAYNTGIIISSLHGRDGTRIYSKKINKSEAQQTLSEEEKKVLAEALQ